MMDREHFVFILGGILRKALGYKKQRIMIQELKRKGQYL